MSYIQSFVTRMQKVELATRGEAVISLNMCTCTHVRTSTFFLFFVHVCRFAKFFFRMGISFCKNPRKTCFFCASVHVDIKNDYKNYMFTCLHVLRVHIISPNRINLCARKTCRHVDMQHKIAYVEPADGNLEPADRNVELSPPSCSIHKHKLKMTRQPHPPRLRPPSPWNHPPWARIAAPRLPVSPLQAPGARVRARCV